jgi:hypothetical protein
MTIPDFINAPAPRSVTKAEKDLLIEATVIPEMIVRDYTVKSSLRTFVRAQRTACTAISDFYARPGIVDSVQAAEMNMHKEICLAARLSKSYRDQAREACALRRKILNEISSLEALDSMEWEDDLDSEYHMEWVDFATRCEALPFRMEALDTIYGKVHDNRVMLEDCKGVFFDY